MTLQQLNQAALRVLSAWASGQKPTPEDSAAVRRQALPSETHLPIDELACLVVKRVRNQIDAGSAQDEYRLAQRSKTA
jgi:hypothetical protein